MRLSRLPKQLRRPDPNAHVVRALLGPLAEALAVARTANEAAPRTG